MLQEVQVGEDSTSSNIHQPSITRDWGRINIIGVKSLWMIDRCFLLSWEAIQYTNRILENCSTFTLVVDMKGADHSREILFVCVLFYEASTIGVILKGTSKVKFFFNEKNLWACRFKRKCHCRLVTSSTTYICRCDMH